MQWKGEKRKFGGIDWCLKTTFWIFLGRYKEGKKGKREKEEKRKEKKRKEKKRKEKKILQQKSENIMWLILLLLKNKFEKNFLTTQTNFKKCKVFLDKRVPMQAGLGGGSGNAATAMHAFNTLCGYPRKI